MRLTGSLMAGVAVLCMALSLIPVGAAAAGSDSVMTGDLDALEKKLAPLGWRVERSPAGDLLLWPPAEKAPARQAPAVGERIGSNDLQRLQADLERKGWQVERDRDGSLLLYPGGRGSNATGSEPAAPLDDIRALLAASGWVVEKREGGDLLLYPGSPSSPTAPPPAAAEVGQTDLDAVEKAVEQAGWRAERKEDGSLILYPRSAASTTVRAAEQDPVSAGRVTLPIDSWKEARLVGLHWLRLQQDDTLTLGRIRKVNWIYLISIVDKSPPYRLRNQLAIRSQDGRVVPIY